MSCLFYAHHEPVVAPTAADVGVTNASMTVSSSSVASSMSSITNYKQISKTKWLDVHPINPWAVTADEVRLWRYRALFCVR
jgi:hypothetical protein